MYRRPKFLEILLEIRQEMAREADYDADLFAELVRHGRPAAADKEPTHADNAEFRAKRPTAARRGKP